VKNEHEHRRRRQPQGQIPARAALAKPGPPIEDLQAIRSVPVTPADLDRVKNLQVNWRAWVKDRLSEENRTLFEKYGFDIPDPASTRVRADDHSVGRRKVSSEC